MGVFSIMDISLVSYFVYRILNTFEGGKVNMDEYTEEFLRYAYVKCERCGKELKYDPNLPRNHVFLHLSEEDGKLHFVDPKTVEPYCLDCMWGLTGGKKDD